MKKIEYHNGFLEFLKKVQNFLNLIEICLDYNTDDNSV